MRPPFRPHACRSHSAMAVVSMLCACAAGGLPELAPRPPVTVRVAETLEMPLPVVGGADESYRYRYDAPDLPGLRASISGRVPHGIFHFTPLPNHVGEHRFLFALADRDGDVVDRKEAVIKVLPASDMAPVFVSPGAGGAFQVRDGSASVQFLAEVRDADSREVVIRAREPLPEGASLTQEGPRRAFFNWRPMADQIDNASRVTIAIEATDGDHPPVPHDFVVVLLQEAAEDCPGAAPTLSILSPMEGEEVEGDAGFVVELRAEDEEGLHDAPMLYYTFDGPVDATAPDLTRFSQVAFSEQGYGFRATIPAGGMQVGDTRTVRIVASVTDDDDPSGTRCDHRADTPVLTFTAVAVSPDPPPGACVDEPAPCIQLEDRCTQDEYEPNEVLAEGAPLSPGDFEARICEDDMDWYRLLLSEPASVEIGIFFTHTAGDLDLALQDDSGSIIAASEGTGDEERITANLRAGVYGIVVYGFQGAGGAYAGTLQVVGP